MKDFSVEVSFAIRLKLNWKTVSPFDSTKWTPGWATVDVNDKLMLQPIYEEGVFISSRLFRGEDGRIIAVIDDEESYRTLKNALVQARLTATPPAAFRKTNNAKGRK